MVVGDGHFDHRVASRQSGDEALEHAFALDRDQHRRTAERHADLEACLFARLVFLRLRQQVHPVGIAGRKPPVIATGNPGRRRGDDGIACVVLGAGAQDDFARNPRFDPAAQESLAVGASFAAGGHAAYLDLVLVGVEAADQASAVRVRVAPEDLDQDPLLAERLAGRVHRDDLETQVVARGNPALRSNAEVERGRPQRDSRRSGESLAVGVFVFELRDEALRTVDDGQLDDGASGTFLVERERMNLGGRTRSITDIRPVVAEL